MFPLEHNKTLDIMNNGGFAVGIQLRSRSPLIAELLGYLDFDFLYIETEHYACTDETIESLIRASQLSGITPWVRVTDSSPESISHILDLGAQGIIVPHLESAEDAKKFISAAKYPPVGHRGAGTQSRSACFGCMDRAAYMKASNRNCSVIGMIESAKAVENLDSILTSGIDMIRVGRSDLALDLGMEGRQNDPQYIDTLQYITKKAAEKRVPVGTSATDASSAAYYKSLGFNFLSVASDIDYMRCTLPPLLTSVRCAVAKDHHNEITNQPKKKEEKS